MTGTEPEARESLVLVGAGSAVSTRGLLADLVTAPDLGAWTLRLVAVAPEPLDVAGRLARRTVAARGEEGRAAVEGHLERRDALPGADGAVAEPDRAAALAAALVDAQAEHLPPFA